MTALTDNRHALMVKACATEANGTAEHDAAAAIRGDIRKPGQPIAAGGDKNYDTKGFVTACRDIDVTLHVAQNINRSSGSAIDARATPHVGYGVSLIKRKRIEQCFGLGKTVGAIRLAIYRGLDRVDAVFILTMAVYNLTRMRSLPEVRP